MKTGSSTATPTETPKCAACAAPALLAGGGCAFCGAPLEAEGVGAGLLDYLATRLPGAEVGRGMLGKGAVRELKVRLGGQDFHARQRKDGIELTPSAEPSRWAGLLVAAFTEAARCDYPLRQALSRTGWAWREESGVAVDG